MVYRGKPSAACELCRKRRSKCDRKTPGCSQCARKGVECPGYRDLADLAFQHETDSVVRRVNAARQTGSSTESSSEAPLDPPGTPPAAPVARSVVDPSTVSVSHASELPIVWQDIKASSSGRLQVSRRRDGRRERRLHLSHPAKGLKLAPEELARAFFVNVYISASQFYYIFEHLDESPAALFDAALSVSRPLPAAVQAVAMASLSLTNADPDILRAARATYSTALTAANRALTSPTLALQDATLISVLLLGMYESILFRGRASPTSWTAHANGALALLRLRGRSQFHSVLGRELFLHTTGTITASCVVRCKAVPEPLRAMYTAVPAEMATHPAVELVNLMGRMAKVRVGFRYGVEGGFNGKLKLLLDAIKLERELEVYEAWIPEEWRGEVPQSQVPAYAFQGKAHWFIDFRIARAFVTTRMARLFLNEKVAPLVEELFNENTAAGGTLMEAERPKELGKARDEAARRGRQLLEDLLCTVPYLWDPEMDKLGTAFESRLLIWPLIIAAQSELCYPEAREYVLSVLRRMGDGKAFPQAAAAARMLEDGVLPEDWIHLWHVS